MDAQEPTITASELDQAIVAADVNDKKTGPANPQIHKRDKKMDRGLAMKGFIRGLVRNSTDGFKDPKKKWSKGKKAFILRQAAATLRNMTVSERMAVAKKF